MPTELRITGLDELRDALRKLPDALVADAAAIVRHAADQTARDVATVYSQHQVTGNLAAHLRVDHAGSRAGATSRVLSTARHAHFFERGTKARTWKKSNKSTGQMWTRQKNPNALITAAIARRRVMTDALIEVVERAGLTVAGPVL